ncbi:MAG TPA: EpsG family protein [Gammaproteobacteria bacterium]
MEVYLSTFFLLLALAAVDVYSGRRSLSLLCLTVGTVLVVLLIGLRWETGNDWNPYLRYYTAVDSFGPLWLGWEPGYRLLVLLAKAAGLHYSGFLLLSAAIYMSAFACVFARFRHPAVLLLFFFCVYALGFMGTQRQTLALGFASLAILRFYDGKTLSGLFLVALATSFHYTAVLTPLALLVPRTRLSFPWVAAGLIAGFLLYRLDVVGEIVEAALNAFGAEGYVLRRLLAYSAGGSWEEAAAAFSPLAEVLWFAKRVVLVIAFWLLCSREQRSFDNYLVNLYALSVLIFLATTKAVPLVALRAPLYFAFFEIALIYIALARVGGVFRRESLVFLGGPLAAVRLYAAVFLYVPELYVPYKSVFLNTDYARFMF